MSRLSEETLESHLHFLSFFWVKEFFSEIWISKMSVRMNFRIIRKNHQADSKIGSSQKIDFRADGTHEPHPTALELSYVWKNSFLINDYFISVDLISAEVISLLTDFAWSVARATLWFSTNAMLYLEGKFLPSGFFTQLSISKWPSFEVAYFQNDWFGS